MIRNKIWRRWAKAIGEKSGKDDKEADYIAGIRTIVFLTYLITNCFIISGVIRHWNDVPSEVSQTQEKGLCKPYSNIHEN